MINGQRILRINHNLSGNGKDVYVFEDNLRVCQLMSEYSKDKNLKEKYYGNNKRIC